jgi:hypothetical protein
MKQTFIGEPTWASPWCRSFDIFRSIVTAGSMIALEVGGYVITL